MGEEGDFTAHSPVYTSIMLGDVASLKAPDPRIAQTIRAYIQEIRSAMPHLEIDEPEMRAFQFGAQCAVYPNGMAVMMLRTTVGRMPFSEEELEDPDFEPNVPFVMDGQLAFARDGFAVVGSQFDADIIFTVLIADPEQSRLLSFFIVGDDIRVIESDVNFCEHCEGIHGDDEASSDGLHQSGRNTEFDAMIAEDFGEEALGSSFASEQAALVVLRSIRWFAIQVLEFQSRFFS